MSDESAGPEPADLEDVRRLLADARHDEPIPADVAARLDRVLAGLAQERTEVPAGARVIPLEAHRRRRAAALLVAAAAIVTGGVALAQHLPGNAGPSAGSVTAGGEDTAGGTTGKSGTGHQPRVPTASADAAAAPLRTKSGGVLVRPRHFSADALSGRRVAGATESQFDSLKAVSPGCVPSVGKAVVVPATYEKAPAALVYHAPAGTTQIVDLYVCGQATPLRSVTLPTP